MVIWLTHGFTTVLSNWWATNSLQASVSNLLMIVSVVNCLRICFNKLLFARRDFPATDWPILHNVKKSTTWYTRNGRDLKSAISRRNATVYSIAELVSYPPAVWLWRMHTHALSELTDVLWHLSATGLTLPSQRLANSYLTSREKTCIIHVAFSTCLFLHPCWFRNTFSAPHAPRLSLQ